MQYKSCQTFLSLWLNIESVSPFIDNSLGYEDLSVLNPWETGEHWAKATETEFEAEQTAQFRF